MIVPLSQLRQPEITKEATTDHIHELIDREDFIEPEMMNGFMANVIRGLMTECIKLRDKLTQKNSRLRGLEQSNEEHREDVQNYKLKYDTLLRNINKVVKATARTSSCRRFVKDFDYKTRRVNSRHVPIFRIVCKECSSVIDP